MPPLYQRVYDAVSGDIKAGRLKPGDRVPSISQLAAAHEVGVTTVKTALLMLRGDGWVTTQQGKATYVAPDPPIE